MNLLGACLGRGVRSKLHRNSRGQASVEFALVMLLFLSFTLFFVQLSLMMAWGNYVQYATFMSARALLSSGPDQDDQLSRARDVLATMVKRSSALAGIDRFPSIAKGVGSDGGSGITGAQIGAGDLFEEGDRLSSWQEGVRYTFKSRLFYLPMGKSSSKSKKDDSVNSIELTSESWLLREKTVSECMGHMRARSGNEVVIDNGC